MSDDKTRRSRARATIAVASCVVLALASAIVGKTHAGVALDHHVFHAISMPVGSRLWSDADMFNNRIIDLVGIGGVVLCAFAARRRAYLNAIAIGLCIVISVVLAEGLKRAGVAVPREHLLAGYESSWPSGHAAAVSALGASAVLLPIGAAVRKVLLCGGVMLLAVTCLTLLVTAAHTPFDLLGGAAIGATVCALAWWVLRGAMTSRAGQLAGSRILSGQDDDTGL